MVTLEIPFGILVVLSIIGYLIVGLVTTFFVAKFFNRFESNDTPPPCGFGFLWPFSIPLTLIVFVGFGIYQLFAWAEGQAKKSEIC